MKPAYEHPYVDADPPPWWVRRFKLLRQTWFNPLFQRNYRKSKLKRWVQPRLAALIGIGLGILFGVLALGGPIPPWGIMGLPTIFHFLFWLVFLRLYFSCLVDTPRMIKSDLVTSELDSIMVTPMPDRNLYYAMCLPNFVRAMEVVESILAFILGYYAPTILLRLLQQLIVFGTGFNFYTILEILGVGLFALILAMSLLIVSYSSGIYAATLPIVGSVFANLAHSFTIFMLPTFVWWGWCAVNVQTGWCGTWMFAYLFPFFHPVGILINLTFVIGGFILTRNLGIASFKRMRRSGYYRPEHTTAAGLIEN